MPTRWMLAAFAALLPGSGHASAPLPEPGSFELLAIAGVAAIVIGVRNRRN